MTMIKIDREKTLLDDLKANHLFYFENTKPRAKKGAKKAQTKTYLQILNTIPKNLNSEEKKFMKFVAKYYKSFLIGSPHQLEHLRLLVEFYFSDKLIDALRNKDSTIHQHLNKIFNYDSFTRRSPNKWGAYCLTSRLDVNICPYCNRQFITTYHSETGRTRPALDHFYDKGTHPYFAISLFNLIPSCAICNSSFKGKADFTLYTHIHPYVEDFSQVLNFSAGFKYVNEKVENRVDIDAFLGIGKNFSIKLVESDEVLEDKTGDLIKKAKRGRNSADAFKLEEIYAYHKDYVHDLIRKAIYYNEARLEDIHNTHQDLFESKEEVLSWVLGLDSNMENHEKRVLSKFIYDIACELGITKYVN